MPQRAFRFVPDDHAHAPHLRRFRELVEQSDAYGGLASASEDGVVTERKLLRLSADEPGELRWVYLSLQRAGCDGRFEASTFLYSARTERLTRYAFPADPYLTTLPEVVSEGRVARALQFVPRRRFVYLTHDGLVGKVMRPADRAPAYVRLCAVHDAAAHADASFRVARPAGIDPRTGVFFQEQVTGRDLALSLTVANLDELLWQVGGVQAEVHALAIAAAPRWSQQLFSQELRSHLELVSLYRPREGALLAQAVERLERIRPDLTPRPVFCHGDLHCGHLLLDDGVWAAIDFGGCRLGDPCQDVARLLAFLKRDVPFLRERFADPSCADLLLDQAVDAFVDGYETQAGAALDRRRLRWYLAAHELDYLAGMLERDLYDAVSFARGVERVLALSCRAGRQPAAAVVRA